MAKLTPEQQDTIIAARKSGRLSVAAISRFTGVRPYVVKAYLIEAGLIPKPANPNPVSLTLDDDTFDGLARAALRQKRTLADVLRDATRHYLEARNG